MLKIKISLSVAGFLVMAIPLAPSVVAGTLDANGQVDGERHALYILGSPPMRAAMARLRHVFQRDSLGASAGGRSSLDSAVSAYALTAVQYALAEDGARPALAWIMNARHSWHGLSVPRSGFNVDNPDNIYRTAAIDGNSEYEIRGKVRAPGPLQETFLLYGPAQMGTAVMNQEAGNVLAVLRSDQMQIAQDGSFVITMDRRPAKGLRNHIQLNSDSRMLFVRDTLSDWDHQNPVTLSIRRSSGSAITSPLSDSQLSYRSAELLGLIGPYWIAWNRRFIYSKPANEVIFPNDRSGGWGLISMDHFDLAYDQALVVTINRLGAGYLGFQTTDPWGIAWDYVNRIRSINNSQAKPNRDGSYTYVIAARDPGAPNWLDTAGQRNGIFTIRWQGLPHEARTEQAVVRVRVVNLAAVKQALPSGSQFITPWDRARQIAARARSHNRRMD